MIEALFQNTPPFEIRDARGRVIVTSRFSLGSGNYYVTTNRAGEMLQLSDEKVLQRPLLLAVAERDAICVASAYDPSGKDRVLNGFASHIFPPCHQAYWNANKLGRGIPPTPDGKIHAMQNGLLLSEGLHILFNQYVFAVDPDEGHRIIRFQDPLPFDNLASQLPRWTVVGKDRPSAKLLRWHLHQAILANMRGGRDPLFVKYPYTSTRRILASPDAAEMMEAEIFGYLALTRDLDDPDKRHYPESETDVSEEEKQHAHGDGRSGQQDEKEERSGDAQIEWTRL
ncbi:hypothetical protein SCUCBS95973_007950 [Sporothrix curviconia]|uniref:HNH nuclease domain-containing protein n=1 Tax=Sporothrix curviconia TaxID=1260050 RepID=A0ABP0CIV5_9PEZI